MTENSTSAREFLKSLSTQDFLSFGVQQVAYIRPVSSEGQKGWSVHAADGTQLTTLDSSEAAEALIRHNDLEPVTLQ